MLWDIKVGKGFNFNQVGYDSIDFDIARANQGNAQDRGTVECMDQQLKLSLQNLNSANQ